MSQLLKGIGLMGAGAYGYQQVQSHEMVGTLGRMMGALDGNGNRLVSSSGASTSSAGGEQIKVLEGEMARLHHLLSDMARGQKQGGYTVIHTGRSSWAVYAYPALGVGLAYVYCRIRGINMFDLFYVSQSSMSQFKITVTEGFTRLWDEVRKHKDELMGKLGLVSQKQEQMMESQALLDERLQQVGDNVDDVKVNTHNINNRVNKIDHKVSDVMDNLANVQSGIMLLCQTVSDVTQRMGMSNTRSSQALKGYISGATSFMFTPAAQLPAGQPQLAIQGGSAAPASAGGGLAALGLNSLLDGGDADGGVPGPVSATPTTMVVELPAGTEVKPDVASRSSGGPPSFPKTSNKPPAAQSVFWGVGRTGAF